MLWLNRDGHIVSDSEGRLIDCDSCPCSCALCERVLGAYESGEPVHGYDFPEFGNRLDGATIDFFEYTDFAELYTSFYPSYKVLDAYGNDMLQIVDCEERREDSGVYSATMNYPFLKGTNPVYYKSDTPILLYRFDCRGGFSGPGCHFVARKKTYRPCSNPDVEIYQFTNTMHFFVYPYTCNWKCIESYFEDSDFMRFDIGMSLLRDGHGVQLELGTAKAIGDYLTCPDYESMSLTYHYKDEFPSFVESHSVTVNGISVSIDDEHRWDSIQVEGYRFTDIIRLRGVTSYCDSAKGFDFSFYLPVEHTGESYTQQYEDELQ